MKTGARQGSPGHSRDQGVKVWGLPAVLGSQEVSSQGGSWEVCCLCMCVCVWGEPKEGCME